MVNEMSGEQLQPESSKRRKSFRGTIVLAWAVIALLLWWALRQTPLDGVVQTLRGMQVWQLVALAGINVLIYATMALRWRVVMGALSPVQHAPKVRFSELFAYRLSSFGLNYFTPGPFGGEPLQVFLLTRRNKLETTTAVSGVFLDRLLEVLATFTFVVIGLVMVLVRGMSGLSAWAIPAVGLVLALPLAHMLALWRGRLPVSAVLGRVGRGERWQKIRAAVSRAEGQIATVFATRPGVLLTGIALSTLVWWLMLGEYLLMLRFLGIPLGALEGLIALTLAQITFAVPVPGGLGSLEAGQVLAMQMFGLDPVLGLSLSVLIRARDVLFAGAGLLFGGWMAK